VETYAPSESFRRDTMPAVVSGMQPNLCAVLRRGHFAAGQTDSERCENWLICEDLANQLVPVARKDAALHLQHSPDQTHKRVRASVAKIGCRPTNWRGSRYVFKAFLAGESHATRKFETTAN
jgi:hypothetical protein